MNREKRMVTAAAAVLAMATITALAVPGAVSEPTTPETGAERHGAAAVTEVTVAAAEVTGATATLAVDTYLVQRGGPVEDVTIVHRATDANTGLVENETELAVGDLEDEPERVVPGKVSVARQSDYELETFVYQDGERTASVSRTVSGVGSLTPAYADSDVGFHRFGEEYGLMTSEIPAVSYTIASTASLGIDGLRPRPGLTLRNASGPPAPNRSRHSRAVSLEMPNRCAMARLDSPSAASNTIRQRSTTC